MSGQIVKVRGLPRGSGISIEGGAANLNVHVGDLSRTSNDAEDAFFAVRSPMISEDGTYRVATSDSADG